MQTGAARPVVQGVLPGFKVQEFYAPAGSQEKPFRCLGAVTAVVVVDMHCLVGRESPFEFARFQIKTNEKIIYAGFVLAVARVPVRLIDHGVVVYPDHAVDHEYVGLPVVAPSAVGSVP